MTKNVHGLQRIGWMKSIIEHRFVQPEPNSGCWLWTGNQIQGGYGFASVDGKNELVHRVAMRLAGKEIPPHLQACHKCNVPSCCNPDHIYAGTAFDNAADKKKTGKKRKVRYRVTEEHAKRILTHVGDEPLAELAKRIGLPATTAYRVKRNRRWMYLYV